MSGGYFDYVSYRLTEIAMELEEEVDAYLRFIKGVENEYDRDLRYAMIKTELEGKSYDFIEFFLDNLVAFYTHCVFTSTYERCFDYFISGDDGEVTFMTKIDEGKHSSYLRGDLFKEKVETIKLHMLTNNKLNQGGN